jgi:hypothetical protein
VYARLDEFGNSPLLETPASVSLPTTIRQIHLYALNRYATMRPDEALHAAVHGLASSTLHLPHDPFVSGLPWIGQTLW